MSESILRNLIDGQTTIFSWRPVGSVGEYRAIDCTSYRSSYQWQTKEFIRVPNVSDECVKLSLRSTLELDVPDLGIDKLPDSIELRIDLKIVDLEPSGNMWWRRTSNYLVRDYSPKFKPDGTVDLGYSLLGQGTTTAETIFIQNPIVLDPAIADLQIPYQMIEPLPPGLISGTQSIALGSASRIRLLN